MQTPKTEQSSLRLEGMTYTLPPHINDLLDEAIFSSQESQQVLDLILDTALQLLHAEHGSLRWVNRRTNKLVLMAVRRSSGQPLSAGDGQDLDLNGHSIVAQVARTKAELLIPDLSQGEWPRVHQPLDARVVMRSELAVPLLSSDSQAVVGVLNVESPELNAFSLHDQGYLVVLARRAQMAVQRAKLFKAIQTISQTVLAMNQDALLTYTVEALSDLMDVPVCSIWLIDEETEDLKLAKSIGRPEPSPEVPDVRLSRKSFIGRALDAQEPLISPNVQQEPTFVCHDLAVEHGWISALAVPIISPYGNALGVTSVYSINEERNFTSHDRSLATTFSNQVAIALHQSLLFYENERNLTRMSGLQRVCDALVTETDLNNLLNLIVEQAMRLLAGAGSILYLYNESLSQNVVAAACGTAALVRGMSAPLERSLSGWVVRHNQAVLCKADDPRIDWNIAGRIGLHNVAAAPLVKDTVIGTLVVLDKQGKAQFDQSDLGLLEMLAAHATVAINKMHTYEQKQRRSQQLRVINDILSASVSCIDIETLLRDAALQISQAFGYRVDIGLVEQDQLVFKAIVHYGFKELHNEIISLPLGKGITGRVALTKESMIVPDVTNEPYYYEFSSQTKSELCVPLNTTNNGSIGVLNIESDLLGAFFQTELQMFQAIAAGIALAIENARRLKELTALHIVSTAITRAQDLSQVLRGIAETAMELFGAAASALYLADPDSQYLTLYYHVGMPDAVVNRVQKINRGQSIAGKVLQTGAPIVVHDMVNDPRADDTIASADGLRSLVDVPIKIGERVLGVLALLTKNIRQFTQNDVDLLQAIGNHVGVTIEKIQLHERYRQLYEHARDPIVIVNLEGTIVGANPEACRVTGFLPNELPGMNVVDFIADSELASCAHERIASLARGEDVPIMEFRIRTKDNSTVYIEANSTPLTDNTGEVTHIQSMWRDITARKHDEAEVRRKNQRLNALLEISRTAFRHFDHESLLSWMATQGMTLLDSDGCYIDLLTDDSDLLVPHAAPYSAFAQQVLGNPLKRGEGIVGEAASTGKGQIKNCLHLTKDGWRVPHTPDNNPQNLLVVPMKSMEKVVGVISVARFKDRTEQLYTQEDYECLETLANILTLCLEYIRLAEIQHKQRAAEKVLEQMNLMGAFLGHKLGGFLGAVALTTQELRYQIKSINRAIAVLLDNLKLSTHTASRIINQFRSLGKALNPRKDIIPLEILVQTALRQVKIPKNIQVTLGNLDLPPVKANGPLLIEIFEGIIHNAIGAMPDGGMLTIDGVVSPDRYETQLHFIDTGHGMTQEIQNNLFTPFFTTKKNRGGFGTGLWLSRLYIQTLGGDIEVTSAPSKGATFTFRIPTVQEVVSLSYGASQSEELEEASNLSQTDLRSGGLRVLVVEDDPLWLGVLPSALMRRGCRVKIAQSYEEAISLLYKKVFDAFIIDVRLVDYDAQNLDGLEIVRQILGRYNFARVLILSGWSWPLQVAKERFGDRNNVIIADKTVQEEVERALDRLAGTNSIP